MYPEKSNRQLKAFGETLIYSAMESILAFLLSLANRGEKHLRKLKAKCGTNYSVGMNIYYLKGRNKFY